MLMDVLYLLVSVMATIQEIEDHLSRAARGPWAVEYDSCDCSDGLCSHGSFVYALILGEPWGNWGPGDHAPSYNYSYSEFSEIPAPTVEFMAHSREYVETLLAEVKRLRSLNAQLDVL